MSGSDLGNGRAVWRTWETPAVGEKTGWGTQRGAGSGPPGSPTVKGRLPRARAHRARRGAGCRARRREMLTSVSGRLEASRETRENTAGFPWQPQHRRPGKGPRSRAHQPPASPHSPSLGGPLGEALHLPGLFPSSELPPKIHKMLEDLHAKLPPK